MDQLVRLDETAAPAAGDADAASVAGRRRFPRPAWLVSAAVPVSLVVLYAVVQAQYLRLPWPQDAMTYFEHAAAFPDVDPDHWALRIGLVLPLRAMQELFGYSEAAYYALPLAFGAVLVVATYWLGRMLFGRAVGLAAAVLLLFSDVFLESSSAPLPDHVTTALFTAGLGLVVLVARRDRPPAEWGRLEHGALVAAGGLLGWAYLAREYIVFLFPVVAVVFVTYRLPWRKLLWVAAPAAAVFVGEVVLNSILYGAPFERFGATATHGGQRDWVRDSRLDALLRLPRALRDAPGGGVLAVLVWLMPCTLLVRRREFRIVAVWFFAFWVPLTLGTGLVMPSFRFIIGDYLRYWIPLMPAFLIGAIALLRHLAGVAARRLPRPAARWLPGAGVLALAVWIAVVASADARSRPVYRANGATQMREVRSWLEREGEDVRLIVTDRYTARLLPIYVRSPFGGERVWRGEVEVRQVRDIFDSPPVDGAAVVLHRFTYQEPLRGYVALPEDGRNPLPGWIPAVIRDDETLLIYRAPD